jgi:acetyl esterase/lipase
MKTLLTLPDVLAVPYGTCDERVPYGPDPSQFADLRLPPGSGPHPVAVVIHGGCYLAEYDLSTTQALADALRGEGVATWHVEYRRLAMRGGGWPGTFRDIASAVDRLRGVAPAHRLDLDRVVTVGHSAGGHLALWAAARHRVPRGSEIFDAEPSAVRGAVVLAGIVDLRAFVPLEHASCGGPVVTRLFGEDPAARDRYLAASPAEMLPIGASHVLITGRRDAIVPASYVSAYAAAARVAGDHVEEIIVEDAGHYEVIVPGSVAWPAVRDAVKRLCSVEQG